VALPSGMQAAIEAARKGWLGQVYRFRASIDKLIDGPERRHLAKFRGGTMFSEGCHLIDRAVDLLGKPKRATGLAARWKAAGQVERQQLAVLEYDHAVAEISMSSFHPHGARYRFLEILGTNGRLICSRIRFRRSFRWIWAKREGRTSGRAEDRGSGAARTYVYARFRGDGRDHAQGREAGLVR